MRKFSAGGQTWHIEFSTPALMRLKAAGVYVHKLYSGQEGWEQVTQLVADPTEFAPMLWMLCDKQAAAAGVSQEAFYSLLSGDVLEEASQSFLRSVIDFFQDARVRKLYHQTMDRAIEERNRRIQSICATDSLELPGSTPESTPSHNSTSQLDPDATKTGSTPHTNFASPPT